MKNEQGLLEIVKKCYKERTLKKVIDPNLKESSEGNLILDDGLDQKSLDTFFNIAYKCLATQANRPTMKVIIEELEKAIKYQENRKDGFHISLKDITSATKNFNDDTCTGEGRYWKQYEGQIPLANILTTVIVKRWDKNSSQARQQYFRELNFFERKHENIVALVGLCNESGESIIVYEHASNGRLDKHLDDVNLTWIKRLKICVGIATGLKFLHEDADMIHRDIKSSSILLDSDWEPKICNLELSTKSMECLKVEHATDNAYGSLGYLDPWHEERGYLMHASDVYSLGVILMEILCGRLAWGEGCKDHSESLGPLAKRQYEEGNLNKSVFEGIKEQIYSKSFTTFASIAARCLDERLYASEVVIQLKKALEIQEDYETWEPKLPRDYEEILHLSTIDKMERFKDIYDTLCKGFHFRDREAYFSLGINGAKNYVISAAKFSYKYRWAQSWQRIPQSRFMKVAKMSTCSNLNIHIRMRTPRLSPDVNYAVHLVFKFCGKSSAKSVYVNLKYKMGSETFHAYFAIWRDEDWMKIELCRFLNHKEGTNFEVQLESFARNYCVNDAIYVEGIEFQAIDNVKHEEIEKIMDVKKQLATDRGKISENDGDGGKLFSFNAVKEKKYLMLSALKVLHDSSNVKPFQLKHAAEPSPSTSGDLTSPLGTPSPTLPRFQEVIELLPQQVFGIKCKIESRMLTPDTDYICYLVFKLSEKCHGLHSPVRVRNVLQWKDREIGLVCFRPTNQWNSHDTYWVPKMREDGWMEVTVWKFNSTSELRHDRIPMHLKLITYEGTMSGLIIRGLEIRPM